MNNPFLNAHGYGAADAASRIAAVRRFSLVECGQALFIAGLQQTVRAALRRRIKQLEHHRGWICVSDHLPEPLTDVLIVINDGQAEPNIDLGYLSPAGDWRPVDIDDIDVVVTHWQPLPALPAELMEAAA